jgi:hypothetical protein
MAAAAAASNSDGDSHPTMVISASFRIDSFSSGLVNVCLTSAADVQLSFPAALPPYPLDRRLGGPRSRCGEAKILDPTGTRTPTRCQSLYRLRYRGSWSSVIGRLEGRQKAVQRRGMASGLS